MCGLRIDDVYASVRGLHSLGLVRLEGSLLHVTDACVKLMLGKLSNSKLRHWLVVECLDGFEGMLRACGFIGCRTSLFMPLMRFMLTEVSNYCSKIAVCSSAVLSEFWTMVVGGLTPWSSLNLSIEARGRALRRLKSRLRTFSEAFKSSAIKLIEAYAIAKNLSPKLQLANEVLDFKERFGVDLSLVLSEGFVEKDPMEALSILDDGLRCCRSFIEDLMVRTRCHPRFNDLEGFEVRFEVDELAA